MRAQTVVVVAVAALACLGFAQALNCYSCLWAYDYNGSIDGMTQEPKCADPFEAGLTSAKGPDTSSVAYPFLFAGMLPNAQNLTAQQKQQLSEITKLFEAPKSAAGVYGAPPYKVYCAKATGEVTGIGKVVMRGFAAGDSDLIVINKCQNKDGGRGCTCDSNECNSASGVQLSLGLMAVAFVGKFIF